MNKRRAETDRVLAILFFILQIILGVEKEKSQQETLMGIFDFIATHQRGRDLLAGLSRFRGFKPLFLGW